MPLRFWRRIKIAPGVSLNLSKTGTSVSIGPRGAKTTFGRGKVRQTAGLPGTGLFYTTVSSTKTHDEAVPTPIESIPVASSASPWTPWLVAIIVAAALTLVVASGNPGAAGSFALVATPACLLVTWLWLRHRMALGVVTVVAIVGVVVFVAELVVGVLTATAGGSRRRRR